jgi:hypothetical protein
MKLNKKNLDWILMASGFMFLAVAYYFIPTHPWFALLVMMLSPICWTFTRKQVTI